MGSLGFVSLTQRESEREGKGNVDSNMIVSCCVEPRVYVPAGSVYTVDVCPASRVPRQRGDPRPPPAGPKRNTVPQTFSRIE